MRRENWFLLTLILLVALGLIFKPSWGWRVRNYFSPSPDASANDLSNLLAENQLLKAEIAKLESLRKLESDDAKKLESISAFVYSRYPFNLKNELLVSAGRNQSVAAGKAVIYQGSLVGVVKKVLEESAVVQTVFDPDFQLSVKIGIGGSDALLIGGSNPRLTLIPKDIKLKKGEVVYAASPDFPYGMPVGTIKDLNVSRDNLFKEASLSHLYDPSKLVAVLILR